MPARQPLPLLWLLSDERNDAALESALRVLPEGSGFVFRHYHLASDIRRARYEELRNLARALGHLTILAGEEDWHSDGRYGAKPASNSAVHLATAHDREELLAAWAAGADGVFLSPVFATRSHPGASPLGVTRFFQLAAQVDIPVIALGGMTRERAMTHGIDRWGAIDGLS